MKIINFSWSLKNNQINYYLSKLPEVYRTCDIPILFVPNNFVGYLIWKYYARKYELPDRNFEKFNEVSGTAYYNTQTLESILIFVKHSHRLTTPFILFHELRHWYQQTYLKDTDNL